MDAAHGLLEVCLGRKRRASVVLASGYDDGVRAASDNAVVVKKELPAHGSLKVTRKPLVAQGFVGRQIDVTAVIMIAEYGHHAVLCLQAFEGLRMARQFIRTHILDVAGEDDEVRTHVVNGCDGTQHQLVLHRTEMHVGELGDAIAVERLRKVVKLDGNLTDIQAVCAHHRAVEEDVKLAKHEDKSYVIAQIATELQHAPCQSSCQ